MLPTPPASPQPPCDILTEPEARLNHFLHIRNRTATIRLTEILGVGAYGVVYKAVDIYSGAPYAVKALNRVGLEPRQQAFQEREILLHQQVSQHPHIVSMEDILYSPECTFVVMEYCAEGDLFAKITEEERYAGDEALAKSVFLQILNAVEYCHKVGIYHRDLKPENILVKDNGTTVKLADFGLATRDYFTSDFGCGSTFYMSPECQQPTSSASPFYSSVANDIWSLGVILVNLTCGRNPWKRASSDDSTYKAYMKDRRFLKSILPLSDELDTILRMVFEPNPSLRISIQELRERVKACNHFTKSPARAPPSPAYSHVEEEPMQYECAMPAYYEPYTSPTITEAEYVAAQNLAARFPAPRSDPQVQPAQQRALAPTPRTITPVATCNTFVAPQLCAPQAYSAWAPWYNQLMPAIDYMALSLSKHATMTARVF